MADQETEEWAAKSKRIQEERMKANRALAKESLDASALAFLDPKVSHKGYSKDASDVVRSFERFANISVVLAGAGLLFGIINYVAASADLGTGGAVLTALTGIGEKVVVILAAFLAVLVLGATIFYKIKDKRRVGAELGTAIGAIVLLVLYLILFRVVLS